MIVTRQCDTEQSHWPFSKYDPSPRKPPSPRMSNQYETASSAQSDWQGQYSYLPQGEPTIFPQSFEQNTNGSKAPQPLPVIESGNDRSAVPVKDEPSSPLGNHSLDSLSLKSSKQVSPIPTGLGILDSRPTVNVIGPAQEESLVSTEAFRRSPGSATLSTVSSIGPGSDMVAGQARRGDKSVSPRDEDEEDFDDDEMVDAEGDHCTLTAAERTAARRKMKRFRLTHQQTRFLMSEFAKQPHPDAVHRERLSREIPGLSPRQVQVWFQNRRAKIKRLNADDRDRMIKMRAVPDDFDNVQALHSPYGAVHGLGTPMASPVEFGGQAYAEHMMRPLMVDVRRPEGSEHVSHQSMPSGFGGIGFGGMGNSDMMSPLSTSSNDRYGYSSHVSSPMSNGPRTSNPFARQNVLDPAMEASRQNMRQLQPLHLRDTMSRNRADSLQSPLRSAMSWKGEAIDYSAYQTTNTSPNLSERHQPLYHPGQMSSYDANSFSNPNQSPPSINYSNLQSPQNRNRLRAVSATLPLNLDVRNHYRPMATETQSTSPSGPPRAMPVSTQYGNGSIYTTSYPSAPLTAPMEYSSQRNSNPRLSVQNYSASQMSAPIAPPRDFSQAFQTSTTMTSFSTNGSTNFSQGQEQNEARGNILSGSPGHKRKRSLTMPTGTSASATGIGRPTYGNAT
ncbi:hypothetical protein G7046_g6736 [Stylonectria norvegica]|nr:hypothetical protein G7046_g6736 [Stylonectria norvegica]